MHVVASNIQLRYDSNKLSYYLMDSNILSILDQYKLDILEIVIHHSLGFYIKLWLDNLLILLARVDINDNHPIAEDVIAYIMDHEVLYGSMKYSIAIFELVVVCYDSDVDALMRIMSMVVFNQHIRCAIMTIAYRLTVCENNSHSHTDDILRLVLKFLLELIISIIMRIYKQSPPRNERRGGSDLNAPERGKAIQSNHLTLFYGQIALISAIMSLNFMGNDSESSLMSNESLESLQAIGRQLIQRIRMDNIIDGRVDHSPHQARIPSYSMAFLGDNREIHIANIFINLDDAIRYDSIKSSQNRSMDHGIAISLSLSSEKMRHNVMLSMLCHQIITLRNQSNSTPGIAIKKDKISSSSQTFSDIADIPHEIKGISSILFISSIRSIIASIRTLFSAHQIVKKQSDSAIDMISIDDLNEYSNRMNDHDMDSMSESCDIYGDSIVYHLLSRSSDRSCR